jgi:NAD(P)-dependent dehydrogenase (short-subunit alcohol dehydrogenase family)
LVLGAGDGSARAAALRLSALGAAVVAAGPEVDDAVATAGLIAASGGTVRVIEAKAPPLCGADLLHQAASALEPPTDALVAEAAFETAAAAAAAADDLAARLPHGALVFVVPRAGVGEERSAAERIAARFAPVAAPPFAAPASDSDALPRADEPSPGPPSP